MPEKELLYPINPDRSKPWNALPALPIDERLYRDIDVYEQLGRAKEALGLLSGRSVAIPNQELLVNSITLQEAKDSSAIENILTTNDELYKAYSEQNRPDKIPAATKEVLRYREAIWKGIRYLEWNGAFDLDYFVALYQQIKEAGNGVRPPFSQVYIRRGNSGPNAGQVVYTPPRGDKVVSELLENLIRFMNDESIPPADPLLKMAIAHYQFEAIHPFRDGNGRTGRIMNIHLLVHNRLLESPILYLSRYIIDHKSEYYERLSEVSQAGKWKEWLLYMLKAVEWTARFTFHQINDIMEAKSAVLEEIERSTKIRQPEQLVEAIFSQPYTKVKHLTEKGIYAENTARDYLNKIADLGVMEKKVLGGHHYYVNLELYHILAA